MPDDRDIQPIDLRLYFGMLMFRWQIIAVCLLYGLLAGVIYLQVTPDLYQSSCRLRVFRDPLLKVNEYGASDVAAETQAARLRTMQAANEAVSALAETWGKKVGSRQKMLLPLNVRVINNTAVDISVRNEDRAYGRAYLAAVMDAYRKQWETSRQSGNQAAERVLLEELAAIEAQIKAAEDDVIEYQRLHDLYRVSLHSAEEQGYLAGLVSQARGIKTQLMMMEIQFPQLRDVGPEVIRQVGEFNIQVGEIKPLPTASPEGSAGGAGADAEAAAQGEAAARAAFMPAAGNAAAGSPEALTKAAQEMAEEEKGWQEQRFELAQLEHQEKEMSANLTADHPRLAEVRGRIAQINRALQVQAELQLRNMRDRYRALQVQLDAIEAAEYKWQAKHLADVQLQTELRRLQARVGHYEDNYQTLYDRLHDLRVTQQLAAERFGVTEPQSGGKPVWPDARRILLIALVAGLGSGLGIVLLATVLDNKIQSVRDVEQTLKVPFLGGIPFWVHSGLERAIRPIVTEEHSTGAIEAYRALRTSIISAMAKMNEKILIVTSADSKEGKTLTALNLAIMIAQMNKRILLVDMDLRRGRLHRSLGLEKGPGMSDALKEKMRLKDVVMHSRVENLDLIASGTQPEGAAELLQSSDLVSMFMDVQDEYDYVIMDTSPVLRVTDTVIVCAQRLGVVLYVARVNHTPKPLIKYSLDILKDSRVIGLVMNSIEMHKISSLYYTYQYPNYAYYSNAYAYGYNYYYYGDYRGAAGGRRHPRRRSGLGARLRSFGERLRRSISPAP